MGTSPRLALLDDEVREKPTTRLIGFVPPKALGGVCVRIPLSNTVSTSGITLQQSNNRLVLFLTY